MLSIISYQSLNLLIKSRITEKDATAIYQNTLWTRIKMRKEVCQKPSKTMKRKKRKNEEKKKLEAIKTKRKILMSVY